MQSPFSFRRLAPAFDYLGSPFSAFFRPLLLGFPVHTCVLSFFFLSARPSHSFVCFCLASGYSASCSSFQLSSRFSSQRLTGAHRFLSSPLFSPSVLPDFSCISSGSAYSAFLYCFLSSFPASLPQPFGRCSSLAFPHDVSP